MLAVLGDFDPRPASRYPGASFGLPLMRRLDIDDRTAATALVAVDPTETIYYINGGAVDGLILTPSHPCLAT